ncbi:pirin-like protein isoform X2 [Aegilops tauschii subsp. strangulata]|uniref:pirin-like protein isoform X2 n=1 Tax=Aegilops tauschii subsp. strangulata TaxID=200361 RepID=UPI000989FEC1|nr:pirin-like protein isoform X2 [Aegilops tauschii subsp. strangulata]
MLRQLLPHFSSSSSSSSPIYSLARLTRQSSSRRVPLASRKTSSSSRTIMSSSSSSSSSAASVPFERPRKVVKKVLSLSQSEGDGATVRRSIGRHEVPNLDPFLLLDEFSVSKPAGFPDHPHRGFETVTYMLDGAFTHQDFSGRKGTIRTGDVQWMTAGRGIVHSEMPAADGVQKGLQLWINLASKDKMIKPRYQELESKDISQAEKHGVKVRIIAGEAFGVRSPVYTRTPTMYMDFTMQPGSQLHQPIPEGWNAFVYIIEGEGVFGREGAAPASAHHCLVLGAGDGLSVWKRSGAPLRFVLAAGQPLNELVVQQGPFVMNSRAQIKKAMEDYYYGRNGFEKASQWSST